MVERVRRQVAVWCMSFVYCYYIPRSYSCWTNSPLWVLTVWDKRNIFPNIPVEMLGIIIHVHWNCIVKDIAIVQEYSSSKIQQNATSSIGVTEERNIYLQFTSQDQWKREIFSLKSFRSSPASASSRAGGIQSCPLYWRLSTCGSTSEASLRIMNITRYITVIQIYKWEALSFSEMITWKDLENSKFLQMGPNDWFSRSQLQPFLINLSGFSLKTKTKLASWGKETKRYKICWTFVCVGDSISSVGRLPNTVSLRSLRSACQQHSFDQDGSSGFRV